MQSDTPLEKRRLYLEIDSTKIENVTKFIRPHGQRTGYGYKQYPDSYLFTRQEVKKTGFTLIELLVVIFILGMILAVFVPVSIKSFRSIQLTDAVQNITSQMRYLQNKAILEKATYSLDFDVKNSCYWTGVKEENSEKFKKVKDALLSKKKLENNLKIESLVVKKEGFLNEEKSSICFYADGSIDEAEVVLANPWNEKLVIKTGVSGRINVVEQ